MIATLPFPNIDPVIISFERFNRTIAIHWYAMAYIAGLICAVTWANFLIRKTYLWKHNTPIMTKKQIDDLQIWMIIGTIFGGRLGYVIFYSPALLLSDPIRMFYIWEGGMSFHGGLTGIIIAGSLYCYRVKLNIWSTGDLIAASICFGLFFGRIANFINNELWGRQSNLPWAVEFPGPAQTNCFVLLGETCARHPSQLYEAALEGIMLFMIITYGIFYRKWLYKPGIVVGVFFIGYGLSRTLVENFRMADAQFQSIENPMGYVLQFGNYGLTMGQCLSLPMVLIGIAIIYILKRHR